MSEKSILITGCSTGIGRYCALSLKNEGWRVFATARNDPDIKSLNGDGLEALYLDYAKPDTIAACAEQVLEATGDRLFALFNNGAYGQPGAVEDLTVDVLRAQFEANFFGWHDLTKRLIPSMRKQGAGRIVQCSSVLGIIAVKFRGAYTASKFALEGLSDTLRLELRNTGIHVSIIEPGPIETKFRDNALKYFKANIDIENSVHASTYAETLDRLSRKTGPSPGTLGPDAVYRKLHHALTSSNPRARYFVTKSTWSAAIGRRVLPDRIMDIILSRQSG